jgi:hypothetical protein
MFGLPDEREPIGGKRANGVCVLSGRRCNVFGPSVMSVSRSVGRWVGQPSAGVVCERVSERAGEWLV